MCGLLVLVWAVWVRVIVVLRVGVVVEAFLKGARLFVKCLVVEVLDCLLVCMASLVGSFLTIDVIDCFVECAKAGPLSRYLQYMVKVSTCIFYVVIKYLYLSH
jgi:hypothetical protein